MGRRQRRKDARRTGEAPAHDWRYEKDAGGAFRRDLRGQAARAQERLPLAGSWSWVEVGPSGIDIEARVTNPWQGRDDIGGLIMDVAVVESPDRLVVSTIYGGVWRSPVGGNGWVPGSDDLEALGCAALAVADDGTNHVLYAASGTPADEYNTQIQSLGIARSLDGGASWSILDGGSAASRFVDRDVNAMVAFGLDGLLVATSQGLFYSADGGRNFGTAPGYDDGRPIHEGRIIDLKADATDFWFTRARDGLYHGTVPPTTDGIQRIHQPTSVEAGNDPGLMRFDRVTDGAGHETWILSVAKHDEDDQYHSLQYRAPGKPWRKLIPGGASPPHNGFTFKQMTYNHVVTLDPSAPTRGYLGMVSLYRFPVPTDMPAAGWAPTQLSSSKIHADQHGSTWDTATTPPRLYVTNDGGIYRTTDNGVNWENLNRTLRANLVYGMDVARRGTGWEVLLGMQDTGNAGGKSADADPAVSSWAWTYEGGGDGGEIAFQPEGDTQALAFHNEFVFRGTRANSAADWAWATAQLGGSTFKNDDLRFSGTVAWARNAAGDWDDVYVGFEQPENRGRLFKSTDGGANFAQLTPTVGGSTADHFSSEISVLRTASSDPSAESGGSPPAWDHVWVGLLDGRVGHSADGGASFVFTKPGPSLPVLGLAVDPTDSSRAVVGLGGFTGIVAGQPTGHVWMTTDGGRSWTDIGGPHVPDLPVFSLAFSRTNPVGLFLGNDAGVLYTTAPDFGDTWTRIGLGLPRARANAVRVVDPPRTDPAPPLDDTHPPALFVGTHGRSVYRLHRAPGPEFVAMGGVSFGAVVGAATVDRTVTIRNPGGAVLRVTSLALDDPFSLQGAPAVPFEIPAGGTRDLTVRYAPTADGAHTAFLQVGLDLADPLIDSEWIACSGERLAADKPRLGIDPSVVGLPSGAAPSGQIDVPVRLANAGAAPLSISGIDRDGSGELSLLDHAGGALSFPLTVPAGETVGLTLRLSDSGEDRRVAEFTFHSDDPGGDRKLEVERPGPGGFPTWATVLIVIAAIAVVAVGTAIIVNEVTKGSEVEPH